MYYATNNVWAGGAAPQDIVNTYGNLTVFDPTVRERLVTFLDNHDNSRFQGAGLANQDQSRARAALARSLRRTRFRVSTTAPSRSSTAVATRGAARTCGTASGTSGRRSVTTSRSRTRCSAGRARSSTRASGTRRCAAVRSRTCTPKPPAPGLYAFRREAGADSVVVAINSSNAPLTQTLETLWPAGTVVGDALDPNVRDMVGAGGALTVALPARGARVYESLASRGTALAQSLERLVVESTFPAHDQQLNDRRSKLRVVFDRPVNPATLASSAHFTPAVSGTWTAQGREATFFPAAAWPASQIVSVELRHDAARARRPRRRRRVRLAIPHDRVHDRHHRAVGILGGPHRAAELRLARVGDPGAVGSAPT